MSLTWMVPKFLTSKVSTGLLRRSFMTILDTEPAPPANSPESHCENDKAEIRLVAAICSFKNNGLLAVVSQVVTNPSLAPQDNRLLLLANAMEVTGVRTPPLNTSQGELEKRRSQRRTFPPTVPAATWVPVLLILAVVKTSPSPVPTSSPPQVI